MTDINLKPFSTVLNNPANSKLNATPGAITSQSGIINNNRIGRVEHQVTSPHQFTLRHFRVDDVMTSALTFDTTVVPPELKSAVVQELNDKAQPIKGVFKTLTPDTETHTAWTALTKEAGKLIQEPKVSSFLKMFGHRL